jgi:hypothetical protein
MEALAGADQLHRAADASQFGRSGAVAFARSTSCHTA